ncbi:hypothetical protein VMCG_09774 [Cytospora schulzeri]|uniref:Uncharacterized protein n=1 Tax=Cytospora schulzeri TaxID=448051 RepID=A0A423VGM2_9PEZI|nr:hypothetical protein VMCG_09774 [Valsa malicola]
MATRVHRYSRLFDVDLDVDSLGSLERDTADDFIPSPEIDLDAIAATLAAGPGPACYYTSAHKRGASVRKVRPYREAHVKRLRISCDNFGGQTPEIPPYAVNLPTTATQQQPLATSSVATETRDNHVMTPGYTVFSRLCETLRMKLREMLFGNSSQA